MGLPIARLSDQYSRKWIIIISLVVFSLMTAFSGLAAGFISLLILRIGVGIGEAGVPITFRPSAGRSPWLS
jgi:MFS family permease